MICRDAMEHGNGVVKRLPCGHIFHERCARTWLFQQQICPTCRARVLEMDPRANQARGAGQGAQPAQFVHRADAPADAAQQADGGGGEAAAAAAAVGGTPQARARPPSTPARPAGLATPFRGANLPPMATLPPQAPATPIFSPHFPGSSPFGTPFAAPSPFGGPFMPSPFGQGLPGQSMFGQPPMGMGGMGAGLPPGFVPFVFSSNPGVATESLSDAELRALEGDERAKVLQRIEYLRKFRAEVDAMLGRFGQYDQRFGNAPGEAAHAAAASHFGGAPSTAASDRPPPSWAQPGVASGGGDDGSPTENSAPWNLWHSPEHADETHGGERSAKQPTFRLPRSNPGAADEGQEDDAVPSSPPGRTTSMPASAAPQVVPEGAEDGSRTRSVPVRQRSIRTDEQERIRQLRLKALLTSSPGDGDEEGRT